MNSRRVHARPHKRGIKVGEIDHTNGDDKAERGALTKKSFGVVILDEAHKARASRGMQGREPAKPNNLLQFLHAVARNATNVILGTATPIQLDAVELWDLLAALNQGSPQVLGNEEWMREASIEFLTGDRPWPLNETNRWGLFRNPLPPASEDACFATFVMMQASNHAMCSGRASTRCLTSVATSFRSSKDSPSATTQSSGAWFGGRALC